MKIYLRILKVSIILPIIISLYGCSHPAWIKSNVDPWYTPTNKDPIFLLLPKNSSVKERQLMVILQKELCKDGFNVVPKIKQSKWVLGIRFGEDSYISSYSTSSYTMPIYNNSLSFGSANARVTNNEAAYLYLFKSNDLSMPIWKGEISATKKIFVKYRPIIFKNLLVYFGKNIDSKTRLSKSDLSDSLKYSGNCNNIKNILN